MRIVLTANIARRRDSGRYPVPDVQRNLAPGEKLTGAVGIKHIPNFSPEIIVHRASAPLGINKKFGTTRL